MVSHWEDRFKHKEKLIFVGYVLSAIGCLSYIFVYNQSTLILTQIILGISEAILIPAYDALYSKFLDKGKEASEWGDWEAMRYITTAFAAIIGGYVAYSFGFKTLFFIMFILSSIAAISSLRLCAKKKYLNSN